MSYTTTHLDEAARIAGLIDGRTIERVAELLAASRARGGSLFFPVVGGSAGNCSHAVSDFRKLSGFEAYAPTDNVSELTARYFAIVGYHLDLLKRFLLPLLAVFLLGSSAVKLASVSLGARPAGFSGREATSRAIAMNVRGGPGIEVATVAFEAGGLLDNLPPPASVDR